MPNWVKNRLKISGPNAEKIISEVTTPNAETESVSIDFNKIIPMPKELNIISGSFTTQCIGLYLTSINPSSKYGKVGDKLLLNKFINIVKKVMGTDKSIKYNLSNEEIVNYEKAVKGYDIDGTIMDLEKSIAYGKQAVNNVLKYGHMDWYGWSIENWGTKWNACYGCLEEGTLHFDTAWSPPLSIIGKLSQKYPDTTFTLDFAEEQAGVCTGSIEVKDGEIINEEFPPDMSDEAYAFFSDIWGVDLEELAEDDSEAEM